MRVVVAVVDSDMRLALEIALREEPGVDVVGSTESWSGLVALTRGMTLDTVIAGADLPGLDVAVLHATHRPLYVLVIASGSDRWASQRNDADAVMNIGESPSMLLAAIRSLRDAAERSSEP